jgi:hypothetical protein
MAATELIHFLFCAQLTSRLLFLVTFGQRRREADHAPLPLRTTK